MLFEIFLFSLSAFIKLRSILKLAKQKSIDSLQIFCGLTGKKHSFDKEKNLSLSVNVVHTFQKIERQGKRRLTKMYWLKATM